MGALIGVAARAAATLGGRLGPRIGPRAAGLARRIPGFAALGGVSALGARLGIGDGDGGGAGVDGLVRRRRRRRALTNDDVKTALTIASAISKKAAENFILMRVRSG